MRQGENVFLQKANGGVEAPYYTPASQEEEIYSQLRQEKIKAIPKDEIESVKQHWPQRVSRYGC